MPQSSLHHGRKVYCLLALSSHTCQTRLSVILMQTEGLMFPLNRPRPSTPRSLAPKMIQLRFGANSPGPSPFYSPSANSVQHLRWVMWRRLTGIWFLVFVKYLLGQVWAWSVGLPSLANKSFAVSMLFINAILCVRTLDVNLLCIYL